MSSGINSNLAEELHRDKESSKSYIDLSEIFHRVKEKEGVHKTERISGMNSNLLEKPNHDKTQTLYRSNDLGIHMEEESSRLKINLNIPRSQGNTEGTHKTCSNMRRSKPRDRGYTSLHSGGNTESSLDKNRMLMKTKIIPI